MKNIIIIWVVLISLTVAANAQPGWVIQTSPTIQNLYGIAYTNANTWIAVGNSGTILRSSDGGINWTIITSPVVDALRGVSLRGSIGLAVGISGRVVRSTDAGLSWVEMPRPTTRNLYCVSISDVMTVIMGHEGTIFVSYDNGLTWNLRGAGTASILFGVSAFSTTGVGVGGQGAVVMSPNSGVGWGLTVIGGQLTFFYGTSFVNTTTGWAVGSNVSPGYIIIKSTNSGFVWTAQSAPITEQLFAVSFAALDTGTAVGGGGTIIHTSNSGTTWQSQTSGTTQILNGVSFANSNLGIAVGDLGTILRTTNGGTSGIKNISNEIPEQFSIQQNYPNPFNPETNIKFNVAKLSKVNIVVYDVMGREIAVIVNERLNAGTYEISFDAVQYPSGVYYYRLTADSFSETKKMILIK